MEERERARILQPKTTSSGEGFEETHNWFEDTHNWFDETHNCLQLPKMSSLWGLLAHGQEVKVLHSMEGCCDPNYGPLEEQQVLLISEPSLQPPLYLLNNVCNL